MKAPRRENELDKVKHLPGFKLFQAFHAANPKVYELFKKFGVEAATKGRERFGAWFIWNRLRWYTQIETTDHDFKLNNNYVAYYARLFIDEHPAHRGIFNLRAMGGKNKSGMLLNIPGS